MATIDFGKIRKRLEEMAVTEGIDITNKEPEVLIKEIQNSWKDEGKWSHLYIIKAGKKYYKIGVAWSPEARIKDLRIANPLPLRLLFAKSFEYPYRIENELHGKYKEKRIRGEWFIFTKEEIKELLNYLREYENVSEKNN